MTPKMIRKSEKYYFITSPTHKVSEPRGEQKPNRKPKNRKPNRKPKPKNRNRKPKTEKPNGSVSVMDEKPTENNRTEPKMAVCPKTEPKTIKLFYIF